MVAICAGAMSEPWFFAAIDLPYGLKGVLENGRCFRPRWRINRKNWTVTIPGLHASTLRARSHKLGIVRPGTKEPNQAAPFPSKYPSIY
jgi:hypothetical protein